MTTEPVPKELQAEPDMDSVSQTSGDQRRMRWVEFFDRERERHAMLLMRSKQFAEFVQLLRQWYRETDPFKPPVELPVPEHIHHTTAPPCEEDEIAASQCGKSSNSQASSQSASSCYTTTKSGGSSYISVQTVDTRKTNTIALVVLVVSVLVIAGIIAGVVLHVHMDSGTLSSGQPKNNLNQHTNRLSTKDKDYVYKLVSGKVFSKENSLASKNSLSSYTNPSNRQFSSDISHSVHNTLSSNLNGNYMTGQFGQHIKGSQGDQDRTLSQVTRSQSSTDISRGQTDPRMASSPVTRGQGAPDESHFTRTTSDFTASRRYMTQTLLNAGRRNNVSPTFSTRRNGVTNNAYFNPTSLRSSATSLRNIPITTLDPLETQRDLVQENIQSQLLESNLNQPDLNADPYIRGTDGIDQLSTRGQDNSLKRMTASGNLSPGTSRTSVGSTQYTREPGLTPGEKMGAISSSDQLTRVTNFELTTMTSSSDTAFSGEDFIGSSSAQQAGRTTNTRTQSWSASLGTTMSQLTRGGSRSPTSEASQKLSSRFPVTNQPSTAVNLDVFRFTKNSTTQQLDSSRITKIKSNGGDSRQRRLNSTALGSKFRQSSGPSSKNSAVRTTTYRMLTRQSIPNTTKRFKRLMTPFPRTTPLIRSEALEQFASLYGGGNGDGLDGPSLEGSNDGVKEGEMGMDYDFVLRDMPPPEVLPTAIATKVAAAPPALTTLPPPRTPKPPKIVIITRDVVAEIGMSVSQGLKVGCMAKEAWGWTYMAISRYEGDHNMSLEFLGGVEKRDEWPFIPIDSRMSDFTLHRDDEMIHLVLETKFAMCEDKGRYLCEVSVNRTFFSQTFNVDVKKKPEKPILSFPDDIFAGQKVWITTTWDAGNPMTGHIVHDIIKGYTDLPFESTNERTTSWYKDCAIMVENRYAVTPELSWNGTEIIARIEAEKTATTLQKNIIERLKYDRKALIILDSKMCQGKTGEKLPHPYNNLKFVTCNPNGPTVEACPESHQFDAKLKKCFTVTTNKTTS